MNKKYTKNKTFTNKPIYLLYCSKTNIYKFKSLLTLNLYNQTIHKPYTEINKIYYDYESNIDKQCTTFTTKAINPNKFRHK